MYSTLRVDTCATQAHGCIRRTKVHKNLEPCTHLFIFSAPKCRCKQMWPHTLYDFVHLFFHTCSLSRGFPNSLFRKIQRKGKKRTHYSKNGPFTFLNNIVHLQKECPRFSWAVATSPFRAAARPIPGLFRAVNQAFAAADSV